MHRANSGPSGHSAVDESQRLLELARAHSTSLKKAFEYFVGTQKRSDPLGASRQFNRSSSSIELFKNLMTLIGSLRPTAGFLHRSRTSSDANRQTRHAEGIITAPRVRCLKALSLGRAVWIKPRSRIGATPALIWISLWHLVDIQQLTADDAKTFLDLALKPGAVPTPSVKISSKRR